VAFADLPILGFLKSRMQWHQARQKVLAENIANADTPDYQPNDLKPLTFDMYLSDAPVGAHLAALKTNPAHFGAVMSDAGRDFASVGSESWEKTPGGNAVVLEEEMMKVSQNQFDYQLATTLYSRSLGLLRSALGRNG
jgi:flagellar basal-body rod protein FlgB